MGVAAQLEVDAGLLGTVEVVGLVVEDDGEGPPYGPRGGFVRQGTC